MGPLFGYVGPELCIVGNVQEHGLETMPEGAFRRLVEETVQTGMPGGSFILSPTATPFGWPEMTELTQRNWLTMLDAGLAAGTY